MIAGRLRRDADDLHTAPAALDVVVLTSRAIGIDVVRALLRSPAARSVTVVTAPIGTTRQGIVEKARDTWRYQGPAGILRAAADRLLPRHRADSGDGLADLFRRHAPEARHIAVRDFHDPSTVALLRALAPDLGVVIATRKLRPEVFDAPRLGSINVHLGRAPEFRGSSPGFYELLQGVPEVGVTIHRVSAALDAGDILAQRTLPIELVPAVDPMRYLADFQRRTLVPEGARLAALAVAELAHGTAVPRPQDLSQGRTYRRATYAQQRELRRVVRRRRRTA